MRIIVCVKHVLNTNNVKVDPVKGTVIREGVESILNPDDANALEEALRLKDENPGTTVAVITMGIMQADIMLRECLAMGADEAILLTDRACAGSDTWATANALAAAIKHYGPVDIVFCGRQAIDGDTAQVGPQLAERLGLPQVTYVQKLDVKGDTAIVERKLEDGYQEIEVKLPVLLTAVKELNTPRYMTVSGIMDACEKDIIVWGAKDIQVDPNMTGLNASPDKVARSFAPDPKGAGTMLTGMPKEMIEKLISELEAKHIV